MLCLLGAVISNDGQIKRLIFHDPYGDLTQHPDEPGYYDRTTNDGHLSDYDRTEHRGAYVPYGPDVRTYENSFQSKWMNVFVPVGKTGPADVRGRLLQADGQPPARDAAAQ